MSDAHKAALAQGREEGRAVRAYLEMLEASGPKKRGRKRTAESIGKRLAAINDRLPDAAVLIRLQLIQEKADLEAELRALSVGEDRDMESARSAFVNAAKSYGERKKIDYASWRAVGVDAATLREAGISRTAR